MRWKSIVEEFRNSGALCLLVEITYTVIYNYFSFENAILLEK